MCLLLLLEMDKRYKHMEFVTYFKFHFDVNSLKYFPKGEFDQIHIHFDKKYNESKRPLTCSIEQDQPKFAPKKDGHSSKICLD